MSSPATLITWSGKTGLIAHDRRFNFLPITQCDMNKLYQFHIQSQLDSSGQLLLATFPKHSGDPYERSGALMELWPTRRWLYSSMMLNKELCCKCPFIIASLETQMVHNLA